MAERTVSVDGQPRDLPAPFFVLATENPIEMEGVFPLPEAQLDRFLMKLVVTMPDLDTLTRIGARAEDPRPHAAAVTSPEEMLEVQAVVRSMPSAPHVERFAARLVLATHAQKGVRYGTGPRAVQALMACGEGAGAPREGRAAVAVDDVIHAAPFRRAPAPHPACASRPRPRASTPTGSWPRPSPRRAEQRCRERCPCGPRSPRPLRSRRTPRSSPPRWRRGSGGSPSSRAGSRTRAAAGAAGRTAVPAGAPR